MSRWSSTSGGASEAMGGVRLSMLCVLALGGLCGLAFGGCDRTSGIYWTTDYGFDHEGSILSLPMSLLSAEKYAPHVPRIVFSDNATTDAFVIFLVLLPLIVIFGAVKVFDLDTCWRGFC